MFIKKSIGKKKSISGIHGGFRIIFKLEGKSIFKQTFTFCVIT